MRTSTALPSKSGTTRSSFPSLLKSPVAIEEGEVPTGKERATSNLTNGATFDHRAAADNSRGNAKPIRGRQCMPEPPQTKSVTDLSRMTGWETQKVPGHYSGMSFLAS